MFDVIIIGGGVVGTNIARILSKYKIKMAIIEKNIEVCTETTKANSAIVHAGYDCIPGTLKAKLNVKGASMFPEMSNKFDFEYRNIGSMVLAFNDDEVEIIKDLYDRGLENGVEGMEIINTEKILEIEPKVNPKVKYALYAKNAGVVDPFNFTYAMLEVAIENGCELFTETEVTGLQKYENGIKVETNKGDFYSKYVINAAGLKSDVISRMAGEDSFYIIPTKGVYRLLAKKSSNNINTVLFQAPTAMGKGVLVASTYDGNTIIGPTTEILVKKEDDTTAEESLKMIDELSVKSVPSIDPKTTIRIFTGIRAKPNTKDFMIYPSKKMQGFINVGGIESPGLASAPAIAEYVEGIIKSIGFDFEVKENYIDERKGIPRVSRLSEEERNRLIESNPDYGEIICRCERISKGEILDAIRRPSGAVTRDGIKRRVRAGMGMCQGGFCGPKVLKILSEEFGVDVLDLKKEKSGFEIVDELLK